MRSVVAAWAQPTGTTPVYQVPLGQAAAYGLLSGGTIVARNAAGAALPIQAVGSAGASGAVGLLVTATAGVFAQGSGTVPGALTDLQAAQAYCSQPRAQAKSIAGQLAGRTLSHGVYTIGGGATLGQSSTLTITGDTATVVIVNIAGDLTLEAGSRVALVGVLPRHVYWNVAGALHVAGYVAFVGNALVAGDALVDGVQLGYAAILSGGNVTLTDLSPSVGHNRFFAARGTAGSCANPGPPCSFSPAGSELVIDGSFEAVRCIPAGLTGLTTATGRSDACFWYAATSTSSDYYHQQSTYRNTNSPIPNAGVPLNEYTHASNGVDYPVPALAQNSRVRAGKAYAGIVAQTGLALGHSYHEYLYKGITGGLQLNRRYYAEFSAHLAPASGQTVTKLGLLVEPNSATPPYPLAGFYDPIPRTPTINGNPRYIHPKNPNPPAQNIADSLNWQRVGGVFNADATVASASGLRIIIGNFGDATELAADGPSSSSEAYYFIDNVSLSPLTEAGPDVVLGRSCAGSPGPSSVTLGTDPMPDVVAATYRWTLPDGTPLATTPNLTVAPAQTTTYVLTVTINGQNYTSQATVTVNNVYAQNAAATYVAPAGIGPADLGLLGSITTLDASAAPYGGRVVFDGTYHVRGTVHLVNGTFELRPGTTFLVDGASGLPYSNASADADQTTLVVQNASLELSVATLRTSCTGAQWGGVWLDGSGTIRTEAANNIRSQISGAQTGISSRAGNEYYLTDTDFLHNTVGLYEFSSNKNAQRRAGATGCVFRDGLYGILLAEKDCQRNAVFGGNYDAATFTGNTFSDLTYFGIYATAGRGHFTGNTFSTCGWAAMTAWNVPQVGSPEFLANHITVPASGTVQTQHGGPAGIYTSDYSLLLAGNTIEGAPAPLSTSGNLRVGIDLYPSQGGSLSGPVSGNTIRNLDEGVALLTDDYNGANISVTKNFFVNNAADVVLYPWGNQNFGATVTATIRCNSFLNDVYSTVTGPIGIWLKDMAVITTGLETSPNGNEFPSYWTSGNYQSLVNGNTSTNNRLDYMRFSLSSNENVSISGLGRVYQNTSNPFNACGGTAPGVNSRQYQPGVLSLSAATLLAKLDSLSRIGLTATQQDQLLKSIRRQPAQAIHLPLLEARLTVPGTMTLPNQLAIGLQLLEYYRAQHDQPNTSRLIGWLRQRTPANDELKAYLNLTEATDQMGSFLPGLRPLAGTSRTLLSQAAASGTTSARVACRLLRAYEPTCTCVLPASPATTTRPAASPAQATALAAHAASAQLLTAYPNPAGNVLHVPYALPTGAPTAQLLAYDALGRVVLRQALPARQGEAEVNVQSWSASTSSRWCSTGKCSVSNVLSSRTDMGRLFLFVAGWLALAASLRPALAQQVVCQQQQGQTIPQQGVNLLYRGGLIAISPDSALLFRVTLPNGSYNVTTTTPAGLVWIRRGSCDTARFASLAATRFTPQGSLAAQATFIVPTRRWQVRVLHTAFTDSVRVHLYAYTRQGQLRWARAYASRSAYGLAQGLAEAPDGGMYISAISGGAAPLPITSLLKVDSVGQVKWRRIYASNRGGGGAVTGRTFGFFRPVYTVRGNLLLAGTWNVDSVGVNSYGLVLEANQQGDSLTSHKFPARKPANVGVLVTGVRALRNGGFLITTLIDTPTTTTTRTYCGFTRLTANLQEQWTYIYRPTNSFKFSPPELSQGLELADGSLLGVVVVYKFGNNSTRFLRLSATGQLLQEYTAPSTTFAPSSLAPLAADSSSVLGGADGSSGLASVLQLRIPGLRRVLAEPPLPPAQVVLATRTTAAFPAPAYPNPATESVTVPLLPGQPAGQLTLLDLAGRRVLAQPVAAGVASATLAMGAVAAGTYLLRYEAPGQPPATQRLTVAR